MKIIVYTANFGQYDKGYDPQITSKEATFIRLSNTNQSSTVWQDHLFHTPNCALLKDAKYLARFVKTNPDGIIFSEDEEYEYTIWIDSNMELKVSPIVLVAMLGTRDLMVYSHRHRSKLRDEAKVINQLKGVPLPIMMKQCEVYEKDGYKDQVPLPETGLLIRKNNDRVKAFNSIWWEQIQKHCHRDQMSFGYSVWKSDIHIGYFPGHVRDRNFVELHKHN